MVHKWGVPKAAFNTRDLTMHCAQYYCTRSTLCHQPEISVKLSIYINGQKKMRKGGEDILIIRLVKIDE